MKLPSRGLIITKTGMFGYFLLVSLNSDMDGVSPPRERAEHSSSLLAPPSHALTTD